MKMPGLLELGLVCLYSDFDLFCSSRRSLNGGVVDLYTDWTDICFFTSMEAEGEGWDPVKLAFAHS